MKESERSKVSKPKMTTAKADKTKQAKTKHSNSSDVSCNKSIDTLPKVDPTSVESEELSEPSAKNLVEHRINSPSVSNDDETVTKKAEEINEEKEYSKPLDFTRYAAN